MLPRRCRSRDQSSRSSCRNSFLRRVLASNSASKIGMPNGWRYRLSPRVSIPCVHCCTVPPLLEG
jgi:hypothetical protein